MFGTEIILSYHHGLKVVRRSVDKNPETVVFRAWMGWRERTFFYRPAAESWNDVGSVSFASYSADWVGANEATQPIGDDVPRGNWIIVSGAGISPYRSRLKMRFLKKKFWERSPKPKPENAQDNRTTDVDAERDKNAGGEYRARKILVLIWRMELI